MLVKVLYSRCEAGRASLTYAHRTLPAFARVFTTADAAAQQQAFGPFVDKMPSRTAQTSCLQGRECFATTDGLLPNLKFE